MPKAPKTASKSITDTIALSTRARYARNLKGFPFDNKLTDAQASQVHHLILRAFEQLDIHVSAQTDWIDNDAEYARLLAQHKISPTLSTRQVRHKPILLSTSSPTLSIMVNEEDHLQIQSIHPGLQLNACYDEVHQLEQQLAQQLTFATSSTWGYLTARPTNAGTGLQASVMLHLGALAIINQYKDQTVHALEDLDFNCRGFYGRVSPDMPDYLGPIFQVSNRFVAKNLEDSILQRLQAIAVDLIQREQSARLYLLNTTKGRRTLRAHTLQYLALAVNTEDYSGSDTTILSNLLPLLLPAALGVLKNISFEELYHLIEQCSTDRYLRAEEHPTPYFTGDALTLREFFDKKRYRKGALGDKILID